MVSPQERALGFHYFAARAGVPALLAAIAEAAAHDPFSGRLREVHLG